MFIQKPVPANTTGAAWSCMETHGATWSHMEPHGATWSHMEPPCKLQILQELYGDCLN